MRFTIKLKLGLAFGAEAVAQGDLSHSAKVTSNDEVKDLIDTSTP
jgi:nitrogen fixation/metabolism regulation signal transduction histidine kinase